MSENLMENMVEELKKQMGQQVGEMIEKLVDVNKGENNLVVLVNKPYTNTTGVAIGFAAIHSLDFNNDGPCLNREILNLLPKDKKIKELKAIFDSSAALIGSLHKLSLSLESFACNIGEELIKLDKNLHFED